MAHPHFLGLRWVRAETRYPGAIQRGQSGPAVRRVQEHLTLAGERVQIDGEFGPQTEAAVRRFQEKHGVSGAGVVGGATWERLVEPLHRALGSAEADTYGQLVEAILARHLAEHPREVGGPNGGPWVRLYMQGAEGRAWPWCAGFCSFILMQAAILRGEAQPPMRYTYSCDDLAAQAMGAERFVREGKHKDLALPAIFLVRKSSRDWVHTGFAVRFEDDFFESIEGNTNAGGSREGVEVRRRKRGYRGVDFINIRL